MTVHQAHLPQWDALPHTMVASMLRAIVNSSQDGVIVLDRNREAILMNERFVEMWSLPPELTLEGSGVARREHLSRLVDDPSVIPFLHTIPPENDSHTRSQCVSLKNGLTMVGMSTPVLDEHGAFHGQLIIYRDRTDLKTAEDQRNFFESHDPVTGLMNRSAMFATIEHRLRSSGENAPFALIVIDFDRFSRLNEQFGHAFGDRVLHNSAETILRIVGSKRPTCRHGEDEFMVLTEYSSEHWVHDLAQEIVDALSEEALIDGVPVTVSASAGLSFYPHDGDGANDLVSAAMLALQQAKETAGGRVSRYSQAYGRLEEERRQFESQLSHAAEGEGLELLFQPVYDLRLHSLSGCEALLRWRSQKLGLVSPSVFLPYAEESGLIVPIGEWVLRNACAQVAKWSDDSYGAVPISVNVSAKQIVDPGFADTVARLLEETGCSPFLLSLELTETSLIENLAQVSHTIDAIRRLGVKIYIDDFGTGYSGLSYLKHFNVDTLKIDQSFTQSIGHSRQEDALMQAAISMAHALGLNALAEGVETQEQLRFLMNSGCDQAQGFFLNRPMNAEQFTELLTETDIRFDWAAES